MYAIAFDLTLTELEPLYGPNPNNAYPKIKVILAKHGFQAQQGSLYVSEDGKTAVDAVLAVQELVDTYAWFRQPAVVDIRLLRIDDNNDLSRLVPGA